ncbi:MAG TPA: AI-2E family transporter, partial [Rubrobacteraceae bacterium]|nr:AI-2E family transporter [Rubrobacteraceae bacterium]
SDAARKRIIYVSIGLIFALLVASYLVYQIAVVVLVLLLTMLFSVIISAPVDYLEHSGMNRGLGTLVVFGGLVLGIWIAGVALAPTIADQAVEFWETVPELLENAQDHAGQLREALGLGSSFGLGSLNVVDSARNFLSGGALTTVANVGAGVASGISYLVVIVIATIYSVAQPGPLVNGFVALFPAGRRQEVRRILRELYETIQRWFVGQLASMLLIGVLSTVALYLIGVPFALLLGIFSGLISFIPFVGPLISVIPPLLLALIGTPIDALWVVLAYAAIQTIESYLIQPLVMSRAVSLHPAVVMFALLIMGILFGFVGVLIAVPLVAAIAVLLRELWIERMDSLGTDPEPPPQKREPKRRGRRLWRAARGRFRS